MRGAVAGNGVDVAGGPIPRQPGYYGQPVVKPPVWTWEIPIYLFIGGLAGMSAIIAAAAGIFGHSDVARAALWLAAGGVIISPMLLIADLGRPLLFINMLRVFKPQSAMSMGVWILTFFSASVAPGWIVFELHRAHAFSGSADQILHVLATVFVAASAMFGMLLATYTGVLFGATAIPAWFLHRIQLPIHFGIAGLGSAVAILELLGHRIAALNMLGLFSAAAETILAIWLTIDRHGPADRACHHGASGWTIRLGGLFSGPASLILRFLGLIPMAAICFVIGALISRFGWSAAGKLSGRDPVAVFSSQGSVPTMR